jgi:hypothetical protein
MFRAGSHRPENKNRKNNGMFCCFVFFAGRTVTDNQFFRFEKFSWIFWVAEALLVEIKNYSSFFTMNYFWTVQFFSIN